MTKENYKVVFDTKKISVAVFFVVLVVFSALYFGSKPSSEVSKVIEDGGDVMEKVDELIIEDLEEGDGEVAVSGKMITVHYTGTLTNGKKFDSSVERGAPFRFELGAGDVIPGWDQGVIGMKVGGKRKLTIPSDLGYGARGSADGSIPPGATLVFDIELLSVEDPE